jgi:hypothetical protein
MNFFQELFLGHVECDHSRLGNQHAHQGKGVATPPHPNPSVPKREMEIHVNLGELGFGENNACK